MTAPAEDPRGGEVPDLMAALRRSVERARPVAGRGDTDSGGELRSHAQRLADEAAALDYAETALDETWAILRRIAEGAPDPARVAADLLEAHGHVLAARPAGDRVQPTQELREAQPRRAVAASQIECDIAEVLHQHVVWADALDFAAQLLAGPLAALLDAQAAVSRVRVLHAPLDRGTGPHCQGCATHVTFTLWPCKTIRALDGPT